MGRFIFRVNNDGAPLLRQAVFVLDGNVFEISIWDLDVAVLDEDEVALTSESVANNDLFSWVPGLVRCLSQLGLG